jgi:hypothetical protein
VDVLVHEAFAGEVEDARARPALADLVADGVQEVRLAQADAAADEERVVFGRVGAGDGARGGVRQLVRRTGDEGLEDVFLVERGRRAEVAAVLDDHLALRRTERLDGGRARRGGEADDRTTRGRCRDRRHLDRGRLRLDGDADGRGSHLELDDELTVELASQVLEHDGEVVRLEPEPDVLVRSAKQDPVALDTQALDRTDPELVVLGGNLAGQSA